MKLIGRITRAEFGIDKRNWDEVEDKTYGLYLEIALNNDPRVKVKKFYQLATPELQTFLESISKPRFRDADDLVGIEVDAEIERNEIVSLVATGAQRKYPESETERSNREFREGIAKTGDDGLRSRHFYICRLTAELKRVIEHIPVDDREMLELTNLTTTLMRLLIVRNGGRLSTDKLNAF